MATDAPQSPRNGSGGGGVAGGISPVRAFIVLVIFVVAAVALVNVGSRPPVKGAGAAAPPASTTTTTTTKAPPTTTTTTVPHSQVSVLVANATQTNGLAATESAKLTAQGFAVKTPVDAATTEASSTVYYAAGMQAAGDAVATALGLTSGHVAPLTASVPVTGATGNDVVVVVGSDLAAAAGS